MIVQLTHHAYLPVDNENRWKRSTPHGCIEYSLYNFLIPFHMQHPHTNWFDKKHPALQVKDQTQQDCRLCVLSGACVLELAQIMLFAWYLIVKLLHFLSQKGI